MEVEVIRIAVLGGNGAGKTALVRAFCTHSFNEALYLPSPVRFEHHVAVDDVTSLLVITDTGSYERQVSLEAAAESDICLVLYSACDRDSLHAVREILDRIARPWILVGCKADAPTSLRQVSWAQGEVRGRPAMAPTEVASHLSGCVRPWLPNLVRATLWRRAPKRAPMWTPYSLVQCADTARHSAVEFAPSQWRASLCG